MKGGVKGEGSLSGVRGSPRHLFLAPIEFFLFKLQKKKSTKVKNQHRMSGYPPPPWGCKARSVKIKI